ncbi:MAG: hypothetical protein RBS08_03600 [Bdellovibrionales bacterium]|jgi:hypothetical protein|nr:hypothetical protein [Bdellovibrionales bacterium]
MKRSIIALSVLAVMSVSACTHGGSWTPMSAGRTAGEGTVDNYQPAPAKKADKTFSHSLRK